ncbi:MAG: YicC family protein, partial [Bdellovibrionales bacterium]|nr:YicC family protein [Bdellovibrionales bacterium]
MKSMTGFGTASQTTNKVSVSATLRSVNGRYLDIRPHLPRQYQSLEIEIKKFIGKYAARGTVDLYIHRKTLDASASEVTINLAMAKQWQDSYKKLAKFLKMDANVRLETIAALNDVVVIEEKTEASEAEKKIIFSVLKSALETFNKERDREGKALKKELLHLLSQLKKSLKTVESMTESIRKELEKRFGDRLS